MPTRSLPTTLLSRRQLFALSAAVLASSTLRHNPSVAAADPSVTTTGGGTFLNADYVHKMTMHFDQDDYEKMIARYASSGDKDWIKATVTIDGSTYKQVGLRLKGNSSLMGLRSRDQPAPGGNTATGAPDGAAADATPAGNTANATPVGNTAIPENNRGGFGNALSADTPEKLPWLVRLDKYVKNQEHDGLRWIVIRGNNSQTSLNEAVALDLLTAAGLDSQLAAYIALSANDSDSALRLAIENPKDDWMKAHFSGDGLLFKSESGGNWSYRGDTASAYKDIFDLEAGGTDDDDANFKPLCSFLDFVNNSDDDAFAANLADRLDIPKFSKYLAMMDLIQNMDDIDGPGNNSYLYFAPKTDQATVVPWDMNLAFGGMGRGMGGGMAPNGQRPGGDDMLPPPFGATPVAGDFGTDAGGMIPPEPRTPDTEGGDAATPAAQGGPQSPPIGGGFGGRPGSRANPLVQRFDASNSFSATVDDASTTLRATLYEGGIASSILDRWVAVLKDGAAELVDSSTVTSEADTIRAVFTAS